MVEITDIRVFLNKSEKATNIGYGSVQFNELLWVEIGIRKMPDGRLFVTWPSYKKGDGSWGQSVKFLSEDLEASKRVSKEIDDYILGRFAEKMVVEQPKAPEKKTPLVSFKTKSSSPTAQEQSFEEMATDDMSDDDEIFESALFKG
jgi:hypothetical protein